MKHIIFIICALSIIPTASAADDWRATCKEIQDGAESVMVIRQKGADMSRSISLVEDGGFYESMIIDAYGRPKYTTRAAQQRSINRFKNEYYLECAKILRNK